MMKKIISGAVFDVINESEQGKYILFLSFFQRKEANKKKSEHNIIFHNIYQGVSDDTIINKNSKHVRLFSLDQDNIISLYDSITTALVLNGIIIVIDQQENSSVEFGVTLAKCPI